MSKLMATCVLKMEKVSIFLKCRFKWVGDWFYEWLSPQFQVPTLRVAHFIESFFGAILKSEYISKPVKRLWLAYHVLSSTTVLVSSTSYFLLQPQVTSYQLIHALTAIVSELSIIFTYYIFFRFSRTTEVGKKLEKLHLERMDKVHVQNERDWSLELRLVLKFLVLPVLFLISKPILLLNFADEGEIDWQDVEIYIYPSPIVNYITTSQQFLIVYLFQIFTYCPIPTSTKFFEEISEKIQAEFLFHFRELKKDMESYSERLSSTFRMRSEQEANGEPQLEPTSAQYELVWQSQYSLRFEYAKFKRDLNSAIQRYQTLVSSFASFRNQLEYGFAVLLVFVYPLLVFCVKEVFMHQGRNPTDGIIISALCVVHVHVLFCCCEMGEKFQDMVTMIYEEVYSIPWYLLDSDMRKNIQIFLHYTQQSLHFRSFKTILVNRSTLVRLMIILYAVTIFHFILSDRV